MALPHFSGNWSPNIPMLSEPVYKNLFEIVLMSDNIDKHILKILNDIIYAYENNQCKFNLNEDTVSLINDIDNIIKKELTFDIRIMRHNRIGDVIIIHEVLDCKFTKIDNLYDVSFNDSSLLPLKVQTTYTDRKTFTNIKNYFRYKKLKKIL